jgi:hypothetical protein
MAAIVGAAFKARERRRRNACNANGQGASKIRPSTSSA